MKESGVGVLKIGGSDSESELLCTDSTALVQTVCFKHNLIVAMQRNGCKKFAQ
jgi:hypothetical protein